MDNKEQKINEQGCVELQMFFCEYYEISKDTYFEEVLSLVGCFDLKFIGIKCHMPYFKKYADIHYDVALFIISNIKTNQIQ